MIYDRILTICDPPGGWGAPFHGSVVPVRRSCYAELTIFHRRFWEASAAGTRADRMIRVPFGRDILATSYALLEDGHLYRIEEAQSTEDEDGLPITNLTLRRMEGNYDICKPF